MTQVVDEAKLGEFMGQIVGYMTGGAMCFGVWLGDELGFYRVLADLGPASADILAGKAGCNARRTREWLDGQVALSPGTGRPTDISSRPRQCWRSPTTTRLRSSRSG
jgi:hypothetical protein